MGIALGLFAFLLPCHAATYYVDYSAGSDANNGASILTPFKHCPDDSAATNTSSETTLADGDTVKLKGGVSYVFESGSSGLKLTVSGVTFDGNSDGSWGTGKAILTDNNSNPGHTAFPMNMALSNITIRSFTITRLGGSATLPTDLGSSIAPNTGAGVNMTVAAQNIMIRDCDFSMLGYWFNQKPMDANSISGLGVGASSSNGGVFGNITVTNCTFARMQIACDFEAGPTLTNIMIANCKFTDSINWCVDFAVREAGTHTDGLSVHDCTFYDFYQFNQGYWSGYGGWPHVDGIFFRTDYDGAVYGTNNNFYNNMFYSTQPTSGGTACIYVTQGENANIYNNMFIHSGMANGNVSIGGGAYTTNSQTVNILNNTFYDSYDLDVDIGGTPGNEPGKVNVQNNIYYDTMTNSGNNAVVACSDGTTNNSYMMVNWLLNYDLYKSFNIAGTPIMIGNGGANTSVANIYTWFKSEANAVVGDPKFVDISYGIGINVNLNNFHLQTNSPAIGAARNLAAQFSWLPEFLKDKDGKARPVTGNWDIGAYQFSTNAISSPIPPPQILHTVSVAN